MVSLKLFFVLLLSMVLANKDCGKQVISEQQLVNLSVDCFNSRYNPQIHDGHKLARLISTKLTTNRKILQHLKMNKQKHVETTPVIKWAQTRQKIFINFKLSHRQDSPPCSDVRNQLFNITNVQLVEGNFRIQREQHQNQNFSSFSFSSECFFTNQKFMFRLSMNLSSKLKKIEIDRQGFGSYTLVGQKNQTQIWIDPFQDVHRAAIWPQMRQKYSAEMNQYFQKRQRRLEQSEQKMKKKRKKRPQNKTDSKEKVQQL